MGGKLLDYKGDALRGRGILREKRWAAFLLMALALVVLAALDLLLGSVFYSPRELLEGLMAGRESSGYRILVYARLPRMLAAILAGTAFSLSGLICQSALNNAMASPSVLGTNAGAGFAVALFQAFSGDPRLLPFAAFLGSLSATFAACGAARAAGASRMTLILAGVAISALFSAGTNTVAVLYPDALPGLRAFQLGGLSGITAMELVAPGIVIAIGFVAVILGGAELEVLGLGDETSFSLGLAPMVYRYLFLALAALLAGAAVSFAGLIGFVGLLIPHSARRIIRDGKRGQALASALLGSCLLLLCDIISRSAFAPNELPVGVTVAFPGSIFFLCLLLRDRRRSL
jgi:iron complex transport system permease protein